MISRTKRLSAWTLLAFYGAVSVLGYGLHRLSGHDHHHHGIVAQHSHVGHAHAHCHRHHDHSACEKSAHFPAKNGVSDRLNAAETHDCDICNFLAQARGQTIVAPPQVVSSFVVASFTIRIDEFYTPAIVGLHAPRGPPILLA